MEYLNLIMGWFTAANIEQWAGVAALWILAFDRLAKLTPTTKDDSIVNWVYKLFAVLGVKVPELDYNSKGKLVAL